MRSAGEPSSSLVKKMGPLESILMAMAVMRKIGERRIRPRVEPRMSLRRLRTLPQPSNGVGLRLMIGMPERVSILMWVRRTATRSGVKR